MLGELHIALWLAKLLESDDGSSTPIAVAMIVASAAFAPFGGTHAVIDKLHAQVSVAADKIAHQAPSFAERSQVAQPK